MARGVEGDVRAGVVAAWPTLPALYALVPPANVYAGSLPAGPQPPYAQVLAEKQGEPQWMVPVSQGSPYLQSVLLVVKVWAAGSPGIEAADAASKLGAAVLTAFGNEAWTIPDTRLLSSLPGEPSESEDGKFNGEPVWRADVPFMLLVQRSVK